MIPKEMIEAAADTKIAAELTTIANRLYSGNDFHAAELCRVAGLRIAALTAALSSPPPGETKVLMEPIGCPIPGACSCLDALSSPPPREIGELIQDVRWKKKLDRSQIAAALERMARENDRLEQELNETNAACDAQMRRANRAEDALNAALSSQWRGMESAPKDGRHVLLACAVDPPSWICEGYYEEDGDRGWFQANTHWTDDWTDAYDGSVIPTHWMPLPPPPAQE